MQHKEAIATHSSATSQSPPYHRSALQMTTSDMKDSAPIQMDFYQIHRTKAKSKAHSIRIEWLNTDSGTYAWKAIFSFEEVGDLVGTLVMRSETDITTTTRAHYGRWLLYYPVFVLRLKHLPPVTNCDITGCHGIPTGSLGHHGHPGSKSNYLQPSALQPIRLLESEVVHERHAARCALRLGLTKWGPLCTDQARVCNS
jgi:hypothetical protein